MNKHLKCRRHSPYIHPIFGFRQDNNSANFSETTDCEGENEEGTLDKEPKTQEDDSPLQSKYVFFLFFVLNLDF